MIFIWVRYDIIKGVIFMPRKGRFFFTDIIIDIFEAAAEIILELIINK